MQVNTPTKTRIMPSKPQLGSFKTDSHSHILPKTSVSPSRSKIIHTPVKTRPLCQLLEGYFDASYLISGFLHGFSLSYIARTPMDSNNLKSCRDLPNVVQKKLEKELTCNRIAGPFAICPIPNLKISPIGFVNKKAPGQHRLIHHLTFPEGSSVNDSIDPQMSTVSYATFDDAINLLLKLGPGTLFSKTDMLIESFLFTLTTIVYSDLGVGAGFIMINVSLWVPQVAVLYLKGLVQA